MPSKRTTSRVEPGDTPSSTANVIGPRVRYGLSLRGYRQQAAIPRVNEHLRTLNPQATLLNDASFSRITTQKRPVKDYEILAISRALDLPIDWLLATGPITEPRSEVEKELA